MRFVAIALTCMSVIACASVRAHNPHAEDCAVLAALTDPQAGPGSVNVTQGAIVDSTRADPLPAGGIACGVVTYRIDFVENEAIYTGIGYTADRDYAVVRYAMWWSSARGYNMLCLVGRERRTWRFIGCSPGAMT